MAPWSLRTRRDVEGRILLEARKIFGEEKMPVVVSLDLHGILTDRICWELSDAIVIYHIYPHVDFVETGARAARLLLKIMDGKVRPVTARVRIPALVRGNRTDHRNRSVPAVRSATPSESRTLPKDYPRACSSAILSPTFPISHRTR